MSGSEKKYNILHISDLHYKFQNLVINNPTTKNDILVFYLRQVMVK